MVLALVSDLLFSSKITATARSLGVSARVIRRPDDLAEVVGTLLLVDLNLPGAIEAAAKWRAQTGVPAVGFVSHVDAETASRANAAGINRVLARSRFVELLPNLLSGSEAAVNMPQPEGFHDLKEHDPTNHA